MMILVVDPSAIQVHAREFRLSLVSGEPVGQDLVRIEVAGNTRATCARCGSGFLRPTHLVTCETRSWLLLQTHVSTNQVRASKPSLWAAAWSTQGEHPRQIEY